MKVLIADDQPVARLGLQQLLTQAFPGVELGEARNCKEALEAVRNGEWHLVLLELAITGGDGIEVLKQIKTARPTLPVLVFTCQTEGQSGTVALREGASGFLNKRATPEELVMAIRRILEGGTYVGMVLAETLAQEMLGKSDKPLHRNLSTRQFQVLVMVSYGKTVNEIADELSISAKTVRQFRSGLLRKMRMKNDVELAHYAIKNGLVP